MERLMKGDIISQLNKILAAPQFHNSGVLTSFIRHIVVETIEGRGRELKEYTIGVAALHKEIDFNPQIDSIVRIHAGRLRRALKDYYQEEGLNDTIQITIPKGSYVPVFETRGVTLPGSVTQETAPVEKSIYQTDQSPPRGQLLYHESKPSILILPFRMLNEAKDNYLSITEYLSTELTKFKELTVLSYSYYSQFNSHWETIDYLLHGSVEARETKVRIYVQLVSKDGRQLWAHTFEKTPDQNDDWFLEDEVVNKTLSRITGLNGVISHNEHSNSSRYDKQRISSFWCKESSSNFDSRITLQARRYYEACIGRNPDHALAQAYLSEVITHQTLFLSDLQRPALLKESLIHSYKAIEIDSECQYAYQSLALAMFHLREYEECVRVLEKGLSINPMSTDFTGSMGSLLIVLGHYDRGFYLLEKSILSNPDPPWWHLVGLSSYFFRKEKYDETLRTLRGIKVKTVWGSILRIAAYAHIGKFDKSEIGLKQFKKDNPLVDLCKHNTIDEVFFYNKDLAASIKEGLAKVGGLALFQ